MSRTSPGRYALHEFSKNVYDVVVTDGAGRAAHGQPAEPAPVGRRRPRRHRSRPLSRLRRPHRRHVSEHRRDPRAHQHAGGADVGARPRSPAGAADLRTARRHGRGTSRRSCSRPDNPLVFTAPNLQYLLDSPSEFGPGVLETFAAPMAAGDTRPAPTIRVALHHTGTAADVARLRRRRPPHRRAGATRCSASTRRSRTTRTRFSPTTCRGRAATAWSTATAP